MTILTCFLSLNGKITITITKPVANRARLFVKAFVFSNFTVTTDNTTIIVNGTRTVTRTKDALKINLNDLKTARISVTDNIVASLKYAIVTTSKTDTLKFTRVVNKVRTAIVNFVNVLYKANDPVYNLTHLAFRHIASFDTLTYTGSVSGINEKSDSYTKTITTTLVITNYKGSLIVSSGAMTYTVGTDSYQITFKEDLDHKHYTLVTVTNSLTGKTKSFDRKFGSIFNKWW